MVAFLPPRCYLNLPAITPPPPSSWTSWSQWWVREALLLGNRQGGFLGHHFSPLVSVFDGRKPIDIYQQNEPINKPTNFLQTHGKVFKLDPVNWIADLSSFYNRRKCHPPHRVVFRTEDHPAPWSPAAITVSPAQNSCLWPLPLEPEGLPVGNGAAKAKAKGQPLTRCVRPGKPPLLCDIRLWLSLILNISHTLSLKMKCPLMSPAGKHTSQTAVSLLCVCVLRKSVFVRSILLWNFLLNLAWKNTSLANLNTAAFINGL